LIGITGLDAPSREITNFTLSKPICLMVCRWVSQESRKQPALDFENWRLVERGHKFSQCEVARHVRNIAVGVGTASAIALYMCASGGLGELDLGHEFYKLKNRLIYIKYCQYQRRMVIIRYGKYTKRFQNSR
jgi:hypothetical protein